MKKSFIIDPALSTEELRSFSRTVGEIEWLTVILVLLYQVVFSPAPKSAAAIAIGTVGFAAFVLSPLSPARVARRDEETGWGFGVRWDCRAGEDRQRTGAMSPLSEPGLGLRRRHW